MSPSTPSTGATRPDVILFHSILGLRPGVLDWAERLRAEGYRVHTPDLLEGQVFDAYDAAFEALERMGGVEAWMGRTQEAVAELPADVVYAGFSNGGGSAEWLAVTRPGARGAVLMHAALPVEAFGATAWPGEVPVQIHYAEDDPFRDEGAIEAVQRAASIAGANCARWDYPVSGHLFADPDLPEFDVRSAELMYERVSTFLRTL
jgi:dienelactone hydrolase